MLYIDLYVYMYIYAGFSLCLKTEQIPEGVRYHQVIRIKGEFRENA